MPHTHLRIKAFTRKSNRLAAKEALSLMQHLNLSLNAGDAGVSRLASGAKSKIGHAGKFIADQAVQLHGGMGMSDELNVGHYFKRISSINIQFGDPAFHVLRYAQLDAAA
jgi:alkylation response protein AidB-like acyl-CoA dehydrogenase